MALRIILHTFRMIFGNLGQALKVSVGPYLIMFGIILLALVITGSTGILAPQRSFSDGVVTEFSPFLSLLPLLLLPMVLFVTSWVAVSWHRFILREEYTALLPAINDRPIWPYAGKAILLGLIIGLIAIPVLFLLGSIAMVPMAASGGHQGSVPIFAFVIFAIAMIGLSVIALRMGVALVGTAVGKPMKFGEAFQATGKIGGVIIGVSILMVLINTVPGFIIGYLFFSVPIVGFVLNIALNWLTMMLGISILTTLYGHVIEDRPLIS